MNDITPRRSVRPATRVYADHETNFRRRRDALVRLISNLGLTPTQFSRRIGLPSANWIVNLVSGRSQSLSQSAIERILGAFPEVTFEELVGWNRADEEAPGGAISHRDE